MEEKQNITDFETNENSRNNTTTEKKQSLEETLQERIFFLEEENQKLQKREVLLQADLQNVRKRAEKEKIDAHKYGIEKFLIDLLPALDSISKSLEYKIESPDLQEGKKIQEGLAIISDMIEKTMIKFGVEVIVPCKGENFDPKSHDAVSTMPSGQQEKNTIGEVLRKGYKLNGRVIRAAMVIVAL